MASESASSSVSSDSTITAAGTRPTNTSGRNGRQEVGSHATTATGSSSHAHWNAFENYGRDAGDIINNGGRESGAVTIKTTPPPAYATLSPHLQSGSGTGTGTGSGSGTGTDSPYPYVPHTHAEFGPTPLTAQHPLLAVPYHAYEYIGSPGAPDRRARWRFAGGLFWAVVVVVLMGGLCTLGVVGEFGQ